MAPENGELGAYCYTSYNCSSQENCVNNRCVTKPECTDDSDLPDCNPDPGECLGPAPPPSPNNNGPNCGLGAVELKPTKDCVPNCIAFCDEWQKISGNLTDDTEIKDCKPDDACSNCRTCTPDGTPDPKQEFAINVRYNDAIARVSEEEEARKEEQEQEMDDLDQAYEDGREQANDRIDEIDDEIANLDPVADADEIADLREEKNDLIRAKNQLFQDYIQAKRDLKEQHEAELEQYYEIRVFLNEERVRKLEALDEKSVCKDITINQNRPCYCPPYVDPDSGKVINDSLNRECELCNTETGEWEENDELCVDSCTKIVTCDDGSQKTATARVYRSEGKDVCKEAMKKATQKCKNEFEEGQKCPCPKPTCESEGPFTGAVVPYVVGSRSAGTDQSGKDEPITQSEGSYLQVRFEAGAGTDPQKIYIDAENTLINGGEVKFQVEEGFIAFEGGYIPGRIGGRATIDGEAVANTVVQANIERVESDPELEAIRDTLIYVWRYDDIVMNPYGTEEFTEEGERIPWTSDGVTPLEYLHPLKGDGSGLDFSKITIPYEIVGSYITVDVTFQDKFEDAQEGESDPNSENWDPYWNCVFPPLISSPLIPEVQYPPILVEGAVTLEGRPEVGHFLSGELVSLVEGKTFQELYPDINQITYQWVNYATGFVAGYGPYLYLTPGLAGERYFLQASFRNYTDTIPQTVDSEPSATISGSIDSLPDNCSTNTYDLEITGSATQDQVLSASVGGGSIFEGPFYQWYKTTADGKEESIPFATDPDYKLRPEDVNHFVSCSAIFTSQAGCLESAQAEGLGVGPIENVEDEPTGSVFLKGEFRVGETIETAVNVQHLDGIVEESKGFVWYRDNQVISGANKNKYKLVEADQGKRISAEIFWTTFYDKDYDKRSRLSQPVRVSDDLLTISLRSIADIEQESEFAVEFQLKNVPSETPITSISTSFYWGEISPDGSSVYTNITPVGTEENPGENNGAEGFALNFGLTAPWEEEETEGECPEGWDCYYTPYGQDGKGKPGSRFLQKCPYPCYKTQSYEEYKENEPCERTCQDRCYQYTTIAPKGQEPADLPDGHEVIQTINSGLENSTYVIEYCETATGDYEDDEGETQECFPEQFINYSSIWTIKTEGFDYHECTCEVPVGPKKRSLGGREWMVVGGGIGPWKLQQNDWVRFGNKPNYESQDPNDYLVYKGALFCPFQDQIPDNLKCGQEASRQRVQRVCGTAGKWALLRSYFVEDSTPSERDGPKVREITAGTSLWDDWDYAPSNVYIQMGTTDRLIRSKSDFALPMIPVFSWNPAGGGGIGGLIGGGGRRPDLFIPGIPEEEVPPRCVWETPEQVAYSNDYFKVIYFRDQKLMDEFFEDEFMLSRFGTYRRAILEETPDGPAPLYDTQAVVPEPDLDDRSEADPARVPIIQVKDSRPGGYTYVNGQASITVLTLKGVIAGDTGFFGDDWRFVSTQTDVTPQFRITGGGQVQARAQVLPPGKYVLRPQVYDAQTGIWSNPTSFTITVTQ